MATDPDVIIVGGGVVGAACARQLAIGGRQVRLIERGGEAGEAWRASAGMLAPQIDAPVDDALFELGIAGREFYRDNAPHLLETTGVDIGLWEGGILEAASSEIQVEAIKQRVAWQRQHGHHCEWLDPDEVTRDWPWLAPTMGALLAPRDGSLDPVRLVDALRKDAERLGVEIVADTILSLLHAGGKVNGVEGRERHSAPQVVLAAGAWTGRITDLPRPVSVEPVRGQLMAFAWPAAAEPAIVFGRGGYLLHRNGEAIAGTTVEHAGFSAQVTDDGLALVRSRAEALVPALVGAKPIRSWAGLRPGTPDGLPIVGREPNLVGLWYATGHGRNGVLLAGLTGMIIADLMAGDTAVDEAWVLRPERFWDW